VSTVFGSGLTSGIVTLLTVALSINQPVLSRVFGSVDVLTERLNGSRELRQTVESIAGVPSSPNDPAEFLSLIAMTITDRAEGIVAVSDGTDWDPPTKLTDSLRDLAAYGENLDSNLESKAQLSALISTFVGNRVRGEHDRSQVSAKRVCGVDTRRRCRGVQAIETLLESIAVVRQFYKTITIQEDPPRSRGS